ncbi:MAG: hypothetical protein MUO97_02635, partial [Dehalococcoidia bacterium]|nr:hypothetical protein [Dehalococcoidia bacterium]
MLKKKSLAMAVIALLLVLSTSLSCVIEIVLPAESEPQPGPGSQPGPGPQQEPGPEPVVGLTGTITVGPEIEVATKTIGTSGGTITVDKPGDPLNGFQIEVPSDAYKETKTFKVSSAPIQNHTFGQYFKPLSPLITVENGGGYADKMMLVKIPVKIPKGHYAMGFFYDEKNGRLEGMPVVSIDGDSITVATRHFSRMSICDIDPTTSRNVTDSGFRVGSGGDNWQLPNEGSFISCGSCVGMCATAQWYYEEKALKGAPRLYGYYDNNGNEPKTPGLWQDDSLAKRLVDEVQVDYELNHSVRDFIVSGLMPNNDLLTYWL